MRRPMMMLTLPSSGSTWLVDLIVDTLPWAKAHQKSAEFFAPLTNLPMYAQLADSFGSENPGCMDNIARMPDRAKFKAAVDAFHGNGYTFAKEVYQFFHTPLWIEHFNVFFLYRSPEKTFPPKRLRVLAWYDAIGTAIENQIGAKFTKDSLLARAIQVHTYCWQYVIDGYVKAYGLPVMDYDAITTGDEATISAELAKAFSPEDVALLVPRILETRRPV